jgi:hypothetical protein
MLKKEFNLEKMKYSRNYEASFFLEKINTGAAIDSNLIWSSKSFLPRSAMTNLTIDLFGHSVNLFEIGGRVEGLEYQHQCLSSLRRKKLRSFLNTSFSLS